MFRLCRTRTFKAVAIVHVGLVAFLVVVSCCRGFFKTEPEFVPIDFVVAPPAEPDAPEAEAEEPTPPPPDEPEPDPADIPEPEPDAVVPPKPPKPKWKAKSADEIKVSPRRRHVPVRSDSKLTPEQVRKLRELGARLGDHTTEVPDDDALIHSLIRQHFYDAWVQPSKAEVGNRTAAVRITVGTGGRVTSRRLTRPSGLKVLDESVMAAAHSVVSIPGIPASFIKRGGGIIINFVVE